MKNKGNYLLYICNLILICLIGMNIATYDTKESQVKVSNVIYKDEIFNSYIKKNNLKNELLQISMMEELKNDEIIEENLYIDETESIITNSNDVVIETLNGSLSGYGPDCYGCTTKMTASGKYVGEGNIYYEDLEYGTVRIVAGDPMYPFGTIVKISNVDFYNNEPFYAIVLDRGGDIGKNRKFLFDLLFASEGESYNLGVDYNVMYEILRLGY